MLGLACVNVVRKTIGRNGETGPEAAGGVPRLIRQF